MGQASGITLRLSLAANMDGGDVSLRVSDLKVTMERLEMKVEDSSYTRLFNSLVAHLNEYLRGYICGALEEHLNGPCGCLCRGLNELLVELRPLMAVVGFPTSRSRPLQAQPPSGDPGAPDPVESLVMMI